MEDATWIVFGLVAAVLAVPMLITIGFVTSMNALADPNLRLRRADPDRHEHKFAAAAAHHDWAAAHGFEWIEGYLFKAPQEIFIAAWRHTEADRFFCIYSHEQRDYYDFVTLFDDESTLTTSGTKDGQMLPNTEGHFVQTFEGATHEELWQRHRAAEDFLRKTLGTRPSTDDEWTFESRVLQAIRHQVGYVRSLPLWQLRGAYWYLVRRNRLTNRTVEQQFGG